MPKFSKLSCRIHPQKSLDLFCEKCGKSVCIDCRNSGHRSHKITALQIKVQETEEKLKYFLSEGQHQEQIVQRRSSSVKKRQEDVKNSADDAIRQISDQLEHVKAELSKICEDQRAKMKDSQQSHLAQLEDEASKLQSCREHWEHLQTTVQDLLSQSNTSDFVTRAYAFLSSNQLKKLPSEYDMKPGKLKYREPLCKETFSPEDFGLFLQDNLLGFFSSKDDEQMSRFGNDPETGSLTGSLRSATSVGGHSMDTYVSLRSNLSHLSHRTINALSGACHSVNEETDSVAELQFNMRPQTQASLWTTTDTRTFKGSHLKTFFSAMFRGDSMWICGWNQNMIFSNDTVLVHVNVPDYKLVKKHKMADSQAQEQTIMFPFGESILFAKKGGSKIFNFNTQSHKFKDVLTRSKLNITALCGTGKHIFILDNARPQDIQIFDSGFQPEGKIPTGLENVIDCDVDLCLINDKDGKYILAFRDPRSGQPDKEAGASQSNSHVDKIVVISTSVPCPSVRAVSQTQGLIWELNYRTSPQIDIRFNPCSVTASESGDVFIADRGTNRVSEIKDPSLKCQTFLKSVESITLKKTFRIKQCWRYSLFLVFAFRFTFFPVKGTRYKFYSTKKRA